MSRPPDRSPAPPSWAPPPPADTPAPRIPAPEPVAAEPPPEDTLVGARRTLTEDEISRTHAFLAVSGGLAFLGVPAAWLLDGQPVIRDAFAVSVVALLIGYLALWLHTQDRRNYAPAKAVAVITICNLAGVAACLYFGMFSPAPMILMLPIAYIGLSSSGPGALLAYIVAAGSIGLPMGLVATGAIRDPGLVRAPSLGPSGGLLYAALVQAVYLACFVYARVSRRGTTAAVQGLETALRQVQQREDLIEEVQLRLDEALQEGRPGPLTGRDLAGRRLGALLGRGAMGDVYDALHRETGEPAAVKVLNPVTASDPEAIALMRRESELLASLSSPHIVRVLEVGVEGLPWLAMERLRGESLGERLRRLRRLSTEDVVELVEQVADGLEVAHSAGILHRDLKPSNLFFAERPDGPPSWKILDFGIGKAVGQDLTLTRDRLLGTPGYVSPEQLRGDELTAAADGWSLAVVAYRSLTGARPFAGPAHEVMAATLFDQPPAPSSRRELPPEVDFVLAVALAKRPADRFAEAGEFAAALAEALQGRVFPSLEERARMLLRRDPWGSSRR